MAQYLVAIHHPDNYDASTEDEAMEWDIDSLNEETEAAGVRVFAGALQRAVKAKSLRAQSNGEVLIADGPYLEAKEHVVFFWILEAADLDEVLGGARPSLPAGRRLRYASLTDGGPRRGGWAVVTQVEG